MIELALPWALLLLPAPWLVWRFAPPRREQAPALRFPFFRRIAQAAGAEPRPGSVVLARQRLQMIVAILVWALIVTALARPERIGEPIEITKAARDVILAIDISGSMDEHDFVAEDGSRVQRLEVVKRVVVRSSEPAPERLDRGLAVPVGGDPRHDLRRQQQSPDADRSHRPERFRLR